MKNNSKDIGTPVDQESISIYGVHSYDSTVMPLEVNEKSHEKACEYLERLEQQYPNELDCIYKKAGSLIEIVGRAPDFETGLKKAIEKYKTIKEEDKESFILIQFLEIFYEKYTIFDNYHTLEVHNSNFKEALSLALDVVDDNVLLGNIYNIPHQE
jgi:hypothetical protein